MFVKRLTEKQMMATGIPARYGLAWREPVTDTMILALVPFNWILGLLRQWWLRLAWGPRQALDEKMRSRWLNEQHQGDRISYEEGYGNGFEDGLRSSLGPVIVEQVVQIGRSSLDTWGTVEKKQEDARTQ